MKNLKLITSAVCLNLTTLSIAFAGVSQWQQLANIPGPTTAINSIAVDRGGNLYAGTGYIGQQVGYVYELPKGSNTWKQLGGASPDGTAINTIAVDTNGNVFVGTCSGNAYKISAGSYQWQKLGNNSFGPIEEIAVGLDGEVYIGIPAGGQVYKINPNKDRQWQPVVGNGASPDGSSIWAIALDANNNFYVGTWLGSVYKVSSGGNTWQWLGGQSYPSKTPVFALGIGLNGSVFAGSWRGYFYEMLKGSAKWQQPAGNMPDGNPINALVTDANSDVYVCTGSTSAGSIYVMSPGSTKWQQITDRANPDGNPVYSIAIDANNNLYADTGTRVYLIKK